MTRLLAIAAFLLALVLAAPGGAAAAEPAPKPQVCRDPPGNGAYSFVRVWNISCGRAATVAGNAFSHYCDENPCEEPPMGGFIRGNVSFNGWDCKVKNTSEFVRAVCTKPGKRFVLESGA
jgi:hypothetical protein